MLELCLCAYAWIYSRARVHTGMQTHTWPRPRMLLASPPGYSSPRPEMFLAPPPDAPGPAPGML